MEANPLKSAGALAHYRQMGDYVLLERIAAGGMGEVWLGKRKQDEGLGELRAVKFLHATLAETPDLVSMFVEEARLASRIDHPAVARLIELGRDGGTYYIAMEHVFGRDLLSVLRLAREREMPVPPGVVALIGQKVAEALDAAFHAAGDDGRELKIVHRDVSPQNVVLGFDGRIKLIDFGIARTEERVLRQGDEGGGRLVRGKLGYMSPEQAMGAPIDHTTDQFSLGICLWELLVLRPLFRRKTDEATLEDVQRARVPPVRSKVPSCPPELAAIVERMLEKDPATRFPDHAEVAAALATVVARQSPAPTREDVARYLKRLVGDEWARDKMRIDALELVGKEVRRGDATPPRGVPAALASSSLFDDDDPHEQATAIFPDAGPLAVKLEREILFRRDSVPSSARDSAPSRGPVHATFKPGRAAATDVWRAPLVERVDALASFEAPELAEERDRASFEDADAFSGLSLDESLDLALDELEPHDAPLTMDDIDALELDLRQVEKSKAPSVPPPAGPVTDRQVTQKLPSVPPPRMPAEAPPAPIEAPDEPPSRWPWLIVAVAIVGLVALAAWALR